MPVVRKTEKRVDKIYIYKKKNTSQHTKHNIYIFQNILTTFSLPAKSIFVAELKLKEYSVRNLQCLGLEAPNDHSDKS